MLKIVLQTDRIKETFHGQLDLMDLESKLKSKLISITFKVPMMIELANASLESYTFFEKTLCRCMSAFKFRTAVKDSLMQQHINFSFENPLASIGCEIKPHCEIKPLVQCTNSIRFGTISLSLSLSPSLSTYLPPSLPLSLSLSLPPSIPPSLALSLPPSIHLLCCDTRCVCIWNS